MFSVYWTALGIERHRRDPNNCLVCTGLHWGRTVQTWA